MDTQSTTGVRTLRLAPRLALATLLFTLTLSACDGPDPDKAVDDTTAVAGPDTATGAAAADPVARGESLVTVGGCNDCHTPFTMTANGPGPDMTRMLMGSPEGVTLPKIEMSAPYMFASSGTAFIGPWGTSYARNLTPDSATGIGSWSADQFVQTIKRGIHNGEPARPIMPPMPWQNYATLSEDDLRAVYAYLRTVPAIKNRVPDYEPPAGAPAGAAPGAPAPGVPDTTK